MVVRELRRGLIEIFGDDLAAVWLYGGSLFTPRALDIDLHILLRRIPDQFESERLRELHARISSNVPWVDELDAWYILLGDAGGSDDPCNVGPWHPASKTTIGLSTVPIGWAVHASLCTASIHQTWCRRLAGTSSKPLCELSSRSKPKPENVLPLPIGRYSSAEFWPALKPAMSCGRSLIPAPGHSNDSLPERTPQSTPPCAITLAGVARTMRRLSSDRIRPSAGSFGEPSPGPRRDSFHPDRLDWEAGCMRVSLLFVS
jgi:hypothetical protein